MPRSRAHVHRAPDVDPRELLPAFLQCCRRGEKSVERPYIVKYLEYATQRLGCHDAAVINFLLTQYVDDKNEDAVIAFVRSQVRVMRRGRASFLRACN